MFYRFEVGHVYLASGFGFNKALILSRTDVSVEALLFCGNGGSSYYYGKFLIKVYNSFSSEDTCEKFAYVIPRDNNRPFRIDLNEYKPMCADICAWNDYGNTHMKIDYMPATPKEIMKDALKVFKENARYFRSSANSLKKLLVQWDEENLDED